MNKEIEKDIQQMLTQYKELAKRLNLTLEETLLVVVSRELIIMNLNAKKQD
jgi:hypothetical protein